MVSTTFLSPSLSASFFSSASILSLSSVSTTTQEPILSLLFLVAASSSFLTRPVKVGDTSRAKTAATGFPPFAQTWHRDSPASGPFTLNGLNAFTLSPGCGPLVNSAACPAQPSTAAQAKPSANQHVIRSTFRLVGMGVGSRHEKF